MRDAARHRDDEQRTLHARALGVAEVEHPRQLRPEQDRQHDVGERAQGRGRGARADQQAHAGAVPLPVGLRDQPRQRHQHPELRQSGVGEQLTRGEPQPVRPGAHVVEREGHQPEARNHADADVGVREAGGDRRANRSAHGRPPARAIACRAIRAAVAIHPAGVALRTHVRRARACVRAIVASQRS